MSNLRLINETEITSDVTTVNITDVFSADFDIYKITTKNLSATSGSLFAWNQLRFINSSGSILTSANYDMAQLQLADNATFGELRSTNQTSLQYFINFSNTTGGEGGVFYIFNPFSSSSYTFAIKQVSEWGNSGRHETYKGIGVFKNTSSCTGFNIFNVSGYNFQGTIRTYGLRVDS